MNKRYLYLAAFCLCWLTVLPFMLYGNMADPARPGDPVGEPAPTLDSIHVLHEDLLIDMRSLAGTVPSRVARVTATYKLRNDGSAKRLELVFIAGGLHDSTNAFTVALNGAKVKGQFSDTLPFPVSWNLPRTTPGLEWKDSIEYQVYTRSSDQEHDLKTVDMLNKRPHEFHASTPSILFWVDIPEGESTITVAYDAEVTGYGYGGLVYTWQLGYVLAPARRWASFGTLDAMVLVPEGWQAATWPEMQQHGDTLTASWNEIPADAIAISTKMPISQTEFQIAETLPIIFGLLLGLGLSLRLGWKKGVKLKRANRKLTEAIPLALLSGILAFMLFGAGMVGADVWTSSIIADQGVPRYSMLVGLPFIFLGPLGLLLMLPPLATMVAAYFAAKRTTPENSAESETDVYSREQ